MSEHIVASPVNTGTPVGRDEIDWMPFLGGELEGARPRVLCADCRDELSRASVAGNGRAAPPPKKGALCFQCYRAGLARERALAAAGAIDTASAARFQSLLPLEPVNKARLEMLKVERIAARAARPVITARFEDARHRAQITARRAVSQLLTNLRAGGAARVDPERAFLAAAHAAELQLPESWLPFVMSR